MYGNEDQGMGTAGQINAAYQAKALAERESEVMIELRRLAETARQVKDSAQALCVRLTPVRRITGGGVGKEAAVPVPQLCPLASQLRDVRAFLEEAATMLDANREQLEI